MAVERVLGHSKQADMATLLAVDDGAAIAIGRATERAFGGGEFGLGTGD